MFSGEGRWPGGLGFPVFFAGVHDDRQFGRWSLTKFINVFEVSGPNYGGFAGNVMFMVKNHVL